MAASPTDLKEALKILFSLVRSGNAAVHQRIESLRRAARDECDDLLLLRFGLQQIDHPFEEKTSRKNFRTLFKEACASLPYNPLDGSRWTSKTLTALSKLIATVSIIQQLRSDVGVCVQTVAGGTTNYHMRRYVQQLQEKAGEDNIILCRSVQKFWKEQLLDSIQEPVHEVLLTVERIELDDLLPDVLQQQKFCFTGEYQTFLNTLHRSLIVQIPLSPILSPVNLSPRSPRTPDEPLNSSHLSPRTRMSERLISLSRKISTPRLRRSNRDPESPPRKSTSERSESAPLIERTVSAIGAVPRAGDYQRQPQETTENTPSPLKTNSAESLQICEAHRIQIRVSESPEKQHIPIRRHVSEKPPSQRCRSINLTEALSHPTLQMQQNFYSKSNPVSRVELPDSEEEPPLRDRGGEKDTKKSRLCRPVSARLLHTLTDSPPMLQRQRSMPRKRLAARCSGYWLEEGLPRDKQIEFHAPTDQILRFADGSLPASEWFNSYFTEGCYRTYVSPTTLEGSAVVLVKKEMHDRPRYRALYCSSTRTIGVVVSVSRNKLLGKHNSLKHVLRAIDPLLSWTAFAQTTQIKHETLQELNLLELTTVFKKMTYKFGVLNWQEGNKNEEDMFSNRDLSPAFKEFLDALGDTIDICDWKGYNGGLDPTQPGVRAVFTTMADTSVLFHVAPYLPYSANNEQQLHRKMHIGNDVAIIIFNEASQPYLTSVIASQFNHIIIVVSPEVGPDGTTGYSVVVTAKDGVPTFGPPLPPRGLFQSKAELRQFLLRKMINGEKAASCAPLFEKRLAKSRELLLRNLVETNYPVE